MLFPTDCPLVEHSPGRWICPLCDKDGKRPLKTQAHRQCKTLNPPALIDELLAQYIDERTTEIPEAETWRRMTICKVCEHFLDKPGEEQCGTVQDCAGKKRAALIRSLTTNTRPCPKHKEE
jgi:hypothetical protein